MRAQVIRIRNSYQKFSFLFDSESNQNRSNRLFIIWKVFMSYVRHSLDRSMTLFSDNFSFNKIIEFQHFLEFLFQHVVFTCCKIKYTIIFDYKWHQAIEQETIHPILTAQYKNKIYNKIKHQQWQQQQTHQQQTQTQSHKYE